MAQSFYTRPLRKENKKIFSFYNYSCTQFFNNAEMQKIQLWYSRLSLISGWPSFGGFSLAPASYCHRPKEERVTPCFYSSSHTMYTQSSYNIPLKRHFLFYTENNCYPFSMCNDPTFNQSKSYSLKPTTIETKGRTMKWSPSRRTFEKCIICLFLNIRHSNKWSNNVWKGSEK